MNIREYPYTVLSNAEYNETVICEAMNICWNDHDGEGVLIPQAISKRYCIENVIESHYMFCWGCALFPKILDEVFAVYIFGYAKQNYLHEQTYEIYDESNRIIHPRIKNFYMDSKEVFGFIHKTVDRGLLPDNLKTNLIQLTEAKYYEGQNYYIFHLENQTFAFRAHAFETIKELLSQINENIALGVGIASYKISKNGEWAVVEISEGSIFIIKREDDYTVAIEKEKANVNYGLHKSKLFFQLSPNKIDWSKLKPDHGKTFESLCELILRNDDRFHIVPRGKTNAPDGGRDFEVEESENGLKIQWAVQCKFSLNRSISLKQISDWFCNLIESDLNGYWLITNNDVSPRITDQFKKISEKFPAIQTRIWQRTDFDDLKDKHPQLFNADFFDK